MPITTTRGAAATLLLSLLACSDPTAVGTLSLKLGPPNFEGTLTAAPMGPHQPWIAEREPFDNACDDRVPIHVDEGRTTVVRADGTPGSFADLSVGQRITAWLVTPSLLMCEESASAGTIVLR